MTRATHPRPSGGPTEHIAVELDGKQPANAETVQSRTDGRRSLADRRTDKQPEPKTTETKHRSFNARGFLLVLGFLAVIAGATYLGRTISPWCNAITVVALLFGLPRLAAYAKRRQGKAHQPSGLVPTKGLRSLFWKLLGRQLFTVFGWQWLQKPSYRDREKQALDALWSLRMTQKILAFCNSKGGSGKTAICVWLACLLAYAIKQPPLALDINENPGHTAKRLGIVPTTTLQLRDFLRACLTGNMQTAKELLELTQWHRQTGTTVISSEPKSVLAFTPEQVIDGIRVAKDHHHSVFCDCGNSIIRSGNWGAVAMADTLVFCGNVNMADSEDDIANTMDRYTELGHETQVRAGIIVIVGAKLKQRASYAARYNHPLEQVFIVPQNKYMAKGKPVDIDKIPLRIRVILLEILVAIMAAPSVAKGSIDRNKVAELEAKEAIDTVVPSGNPSPDVPVATTE